MLVWQDFLLQILPVSQRCHIQLAINGHKQLPSPPMLTFSGYRATRTEWSRPWNAFAPLCLSCTLPSTEGLERLHGTDGKPRLNLLDNFPRFKQQEYTAISTSGEMLKPYLQDRGRRASYPAHTSPYSDLTHLVLLLLLDALGWTSKMHDFTRDGLNSRLSG